MVAKRNEIITAGMLRHQNSDVQVVVEPKIEEEAPVVLVETEVSELLEEQAVIEIMEELNSDSTKTKKK